MALQSSQGERRRPGQCSDRWVGRSPQVQGFNRMSDGKKPKALPFLGMKLDEALARLLQTDPNEIIDGQEAVKRDEEDVDRYVAEREQSIGRGIRRAGKRFRL